MITITGRNVNKTYTDSVNTIRDFGEKNASRNGDVLVASHPVVTVTERPTERVLFDVGRDANPFFHFFECLWMMGGLDDGKWLDNFVSDFSSRYGEKDGTIHGAYGKRWRNWQDFDQLATCVRLLCDNPYDRRVVVSMWDPSSDLMEDYRDVPCNTHMYPRVRPTEDGPVLDLTVCCRSNDIIWGATGANAVHFSFVQEWMAAQIGIGVGKMYQLSNNWHAYTDTLAKVGEPTTRDLYRAGEVRPFPICTVPEAWDDDIDAFFADHFETDYANPFFSDVVRNMWVTHRLWKSGQRDVALMSAESIAASDWRLAVTEWMQRRIARASL